MELLLLSVSQRNPSMFFFFFFFNDTATTEIYTLSLHDALPIYLLVYALARDEDFFEEGELRVVVVNLALDERADLASRAAVGGDVGEVLDDWRNLTVNALLDEGHGVGREHLCERRLAVREFVNARRDELLDLRLEAAFGDHSAEAILDKAQNLLERLRADRVAESLRQKLVNASVNEVRDGLRGLFAPQDPGDVLGDSELERRERVEHGRAHLSGLSVEEGRVVSVQKLVRVRADEALDLASEEADRKSVV